MIDEALKKFLYSLLFLIISTVVTYVLSTQFGSLLGDESVEENTISKELRRDLGVRLTSHESSIAAGLVNPSMIHETLQDVGGLDGIKKDLMNNVIIPMKYHRAYFHPDMNSLQVARGVLLTGPPGTGKTLLARAIAKECGCRFLNLSLSMLENKYFGESSKLLTATFSLAAKIQPCIVFLDEIDGMIRARSSDDQSCVYSFKTELLSQLDGFHKRSAAVIVMACTNSTRSLDPAVRRRLPRVYTVGLPSAEDRSRILKIHAKHETPSDGVLSEIAHMTEGYSGSDLLELYNLASSYRMEQQCRTKKFHALMTSACSAPMSSSVVSKLKAAFLPIQRKHWLAAVRETTEARKAAHFLAEDPDDGARGGGERSKLDRALEMMDQLKALQKSVPKKDELPAHPPQHESDRPSHWAVNDMPNTDAVREEEAEEAEEEEAPPE